MPIEKKNTELTKRIAEKLGVKNNTARVYASLIKQMWLRTSKEATHKNMPADMAFLITTKSKAYVRGIVNLTRRKNHANAAVAALKMVTDEKDVHKQEYRDIMMAADKDFQKFLLSGKRQRSFKNAEASWDIVKNATRKLPGSLKASGGKASHTQYKKLMAFIYFKWLADSSPRRLEYTDTRFVAADEYRKLTDEQKDKSNWVVMDKVWTWEVRKYKTRSTYGPVSIKIGRGLKTALRKILPITSAKNSNKFIFLNSKWRRLGRNTFSTYIKNWFKTYLRKPWTQNTVRSIRVSALYKDAPKTIDMLKLASEMGHDVSTQLLHYRQEEHGTVRTV